jgi:hypothetical protein
MSFSLVVELAATPEGQLTKFRASLIANLKKLPTLAEVMHPPSVPDTDRFERRDDWRRRYGAFFD